jgi:hypothetical protein
MVDHGQGRAPCHSEEIKVQVTQVGDDLRLGGGAPWRGSGRVVRFGGEG